MPSRKPSEWFYARDGQRFGPVSSEALRQMARDGLLQQDDLIWSEGMASWTPASAVKGLLPQALKGSVPPLLPAVKRLDAAGEPCGRKQASDYEITFDRDKLLRGARWCLFAALVPLVLFSCLSLAAIVLGEARQIGVWITMLPVALFIWACAWVGVNQNVKTLRYAVIKDVLHVICVQSTKRIPLAKITDVTVRHNSLWPGLDAIVVQTAGSWRPEATLYAVFDAEANAEMLLRRRGIET
jgi:hypothetical protein